MSKEKAFKTKLGLFVTIAILLFAYGTFSIGQKQNLFGSTFRISSIFQNVNGLQAGNNVRFSGINVGSVADIIILNDSTLQVDLLLEKKVKGFLKKNVVASIGSDGLVGNMIVNISPRKGPAELIANGDFIESFARVETEAMLNKLGNTTENIALLAINLLEVAEKLNKGSGSASVFVNDNNMAKDLQATIRNLNATSQQFNNMSAQLAEQMNQVAAGKGLLGYLLKDSTFATTLNQNLGYLDTLFQKKLTPIMSNMERSSIDLATMTNELAELSQEIDLDKGIVGTLLKDSLAAEQLKSTLLNLNEGSKLLNEDLEALQHNFLFKKYFKKKAKEKKKAEKERKQQENIQANAPIVKE